MADFNPVYLTFSEKPRAIVRGMDDFVAQSESTRVAQEKRRWVPSMLFWVGVPFILIDLLLRYLGYKVCIFSLVAPACWLAALVLRRSMTRAKVFELSPQFETARQVIYTLRDDANPKRNFFGHLDLTGTRKKEKLAHEARDTFGRNTQLYRDEWLSLKTKLYDGNMLRFSAVQREKLRPGYWKRGAVSGKMKWKPEKFKGSLQQLRVRISVNPEVYDITSTRTLPKGFQMGAYFIESVDNSGGIIDLAAATGAERISDSDILSVLRAAYDLLKRKDMP